MDQIDDEDVDEELERLKRKLDRLQSEKPQMKFEQLNNSNRHKQLDDNSFYRAVSKCIIESAAGLCCRVWRSYEICRCQIGTFQKFQP